jgi:glutamate dehydrogenase
MAARDDAETSAELPTGLVKDLAARMRGSLLPGEAELDRGQLEEAARFVLRTALRRSGKDFGLAVESVGAPRRLLRIAIANPDMPFLVDSAAAVIAGEGLAIDALLHPVVPVERDGTGVLTRIPKGDPDDAAYDSLIYIETERVDALRRKELREKLRLAMADVHAAVADWPKLQAAMQADAAAIEAGDPESAELLRWLDSGMLTQLGHLVRHRDGTQTDQHGICRKGREEVLADASFARAFEWFQQSGNTSELLVIKSNHLSRVHRRVPLDLFVVPRREKGKITALSLHAGVWTSAGLAAPPKAVPVLRAELDRVMTRLDFDAGGHTGKALVHALTALPHDLLISFAEADVERVATTMMSLVDRPRPRLTLVEAPLKRHLFAFVWLPRDILSTQVRLEIQTLLEQGAEAQLLDWSLEVEGGNLALLRFVLDIRDGCAAPDEAARSRCAGRKRFQPPIAGGSPPRKRPSTLPVCEDWAHMRKARQSACAMRGSTTVSAKSRLACASSSIKRKAACPCPMRFRRSRTSVSMSSRRCRPSWTRDASGRFTTSASRWRKASTRRP